MGMAQIEILSSEKISIRKVVEKLEININDYSAKCEELNKTVIQVSSDKQRLQQDAQDANRKFNEMKLSNETTHKHLPYLTYLCTLNSVLSHKIMSIFFNL